MSRTKSKSSRAKSPQPQPSKPLSRSVLASIVTILVCLGVTLYVYPTTINPGLPIMLGGCLAGGWAISRLLSGAGPYYHWGVDLGAGLLLWIALSNLWSLDGYLSERTTASFVGAVGFLWAIAIGVKSRRDWRVAVHSFVSFCTLVSLLAWPKALTVALADGALPALTGTFVNPDTFSVLPLMAFMLGLGLLEKNAGRWTVFLCFELGILFLTILATGCRASVLGIGVGSVAFFGLLLRYRGREHLKATRIVLALPLALILLWLPLSNLGFSTSSKYFRTFSQKSIALETTRHEVYTQSWKAMAARPLGSGAGCFGLGFQTVRGPGHDTLYINIAHNDPLEVGVELGVLGLLVWMALLGASLYKPYRCLLSGRTPVAAAATFAAVLAVFVFSLFNFILAERPVLWAQLLLLGFALSFPSTRETVTEPRVLGRLSSLLLLGMAVWSVGFGYRALRAEALVVEARGYGQSLQTERAMATLDDAIALQPKRVSLRLDRAALDESWGAFYPGYDDLASRETQLRAAQKSSPASLAVLLGLADLAVARDNMTEAEALLTQAQGYAPYHRKIAEKQLALAIRQGHWDRAVGLLLKQEQSPARDQKLVSLLISAELAKPASGVEALKPALTGSAPQQGASAVLQQVIEACQQRELWLPALNFSELALQDPQADLCDRARWAEMVGKVKGASAQWAALDADLKMAEPSREPCYGTLLKPWYALGWANGHRDQVKKRLEADLVKEPRLVTARVALCEILYESGKAREAIALARKGLDQDGRSVELLEEIGDLYQREGTRDLARNYYDQALELEPKNAILKAKLTEASKS